MMGRGRWRLALLANDLRRPALKRLGEVTPFHGRLGAATVGDETDAPSQNQQLCEVGLPRTRTRQGSGGTATTRAF